MIKVLLDSESFARPDSASSAELVAEKRQAAEAPAEKRARSHSIASTLSIGAENEDQIS